MSVLEVARLTIKDGDATAFESAFATAHEYVKAAPGRLGSDLTRVAGSATEYVFLVEWATIEDHTERFASSPEFESFGSLIGPHFAAAPVVDHFEKV